MLTTEEKNQLLSEFPEAERLVRRISGSNEVINGLVRYCLWIKNTDAEYAESLPIIAERLEAIYEYRMTGSERGKLGNRHPSQI